MKSWSETANERKHYINKLKYSIHQPSGVLGYSNQLRDNGTNLSNYFDPIGSPQMLIAWLAPKNHLTHIDGLDGTVPGKGESFLG